MSDEEEFVNIETGLFIFEAPQGYQIEELDEEAELVGPNDEFLVVSSYTVAEDSSMDDLDAFANNIQDAMSSAVQEPGLVLTEKLRKETAPSGLTVWSIKAEAEDKSHFFDQYATIDKCTAVVATIEGDFEDRGSSALIEEAVHALEFK
jgi:hypothetical protein